MGDDSTEWQRLASRVLTQMLSLIPDVSERDLETVVPSAGDRIMVVAATTPAARAFIGQLGKILEKDQDKERVVIQFEHELEVAELGFDDVCAVAGR